MLSVIWFYVIPWTNSNATINTSKLIVNDTISLFAHRIESENIKNIRNCYSREKNHIFSKCSQKSWVQWVVVIVVVAAAVAVAVATSEIKMIIQDISHFFVCTWAVDKIEM